VFELNDSLDGPSTKLVALLTCIVVGAILAAVDEALMALGEPRARAARDEDGPDAVTAARYLDSEQLIQIRLLTGRVLSLGATSVLGFEFAVGFPDIGVKLAILMSVMLFYASLVGIATTLASRRASGLALPLLRWARPLELLFALPAIPLYWASVFTDKLYPPRPEDDPERVTETVVEHMIEQGEELGSIDGQHAEMLKSVLEFADTVTREIMVPRTSMVTIEVGTPLRDVIRLTVEKGHSRYPVYRERIDQLEGILYAKDIFRCIDSGTESTAALASLIRGPVFYTTENQKISELLREMQLRRVHVAIVADEYGGTSGMVTLEDIIEEIVGEIRDEHDVGEAPVQELSPGRYVARADVSVHDLADITGLEPPQDAGTYDSVGGMLVELAGEVPKRGFKVDMGDYSLIVRAADERHVVRVEVVHRPTMSGAAE